MKTTIMLAAAILFTMTASAAEKCPQRSSTVYFGKVGQLVYSAMKSAGVKPSCDDRICKFTISDFASYDETDGCGGGTTGYGTSFTYADGKKFEVRYCEGGDVSSKPVKNIADDLVSVFVELGLSQTSGWVSGVNLSKVECVTNVKKGSQVGTFANCQVAPAAE